MAAVNVPTSLLIVAVALLLPGVAASGEGLQTISVVTPATPTRWSAVAGGLMQLVDPWGDESKASQLKRMAKEDRFDLAKRVQQGLLEALAGRGHVALPLTVSRPAELVPGPLARDRLPQTALPGSLLDVSVEWFGLYRSGALESYRPLLAVSYRLLGAKGDLQRSSRRIHYNAPKDMGRGGEVIAATGDCEWQSFDAFPKDRARLWGCMDAAIMTVAERIALRLDGS